MVRHVPRYPSRLDSVIPLPPFFALTRPIFAHEGGWDEALLVLVPLALIGVLLLLANRRMKVRLDEMEQSEDTD